MERITYWLILFLLCPLLSYTRLSFSAPSGVDSSELDSYESIVSSFDTKSAKKNIGVADRLAQLDDERVLETLNWLKDGKLFAILIDGQTNKRVAQLIDKNDEQSVYKTLISRESITVLKSEKSKAKKIRLNNRARNHINKKVEKLSLFSANESVRKQAIQSFIRKPNAQMRDELIKAQAAETDKDNQDLYAIAMASLNIISAETLAEKIHAAKVLSASQEIQSYYFLENIVGQEGIEPELNVEIEAAMSAIDKRKSRYKIIENTFFGLSLGSVLLLSAIGLAITFGVMGVINMAHGEMIMLGAYTTYVVQLLMPNLIDFSLFVAIPMAFIVAGSVGILLERLVIRHLYGRPLETLLATFGVSLILQQAVRSIFSPLNRQVDAPSWMSGTLEINSMLSFTNNRLYILIFSLIVLFLLMLLLKKTSIGLHMRAVTQNRAMANSMGIRSRRVDALTFGLGSGIAGIAGVALSQLTNVGPNLGQAYIVDSFMVVVFGGVGNLLGTLYAAMGLGMMTKIIEPYAGAVMAKILILVFIVLFIQFRPRGLFAVKGRFVED